MIEVQSIRPEAWDRVLDEAGLNDVYARHGYLAASCILEPGTPTLLVFEDAGSRVVFPLILRDVPGPDALRDVTTPYGYGGPLASGPAPPWEAFHEAYDRWCRRKRVVSTFIRFHPLYANHVGAQPAELDALSGVVGWRVADDRDVFAGMHPHHRRLVRKARAAGVRTSIIERPRSLAGFERLYEATMRRLGASRFYFFSRDYWDALGRDLRQELVLVQSTLGGEVVAAVLCLASVPWLHYYLGASDDRGRKVGASHLALFDAAQWAQARGYTVVNLGGGLGGGADALLTFKARFDPGGVLPAFVGKQINDLAAYRRLSGAQAGDGFFPAYRASERGDRTPAGVDATSS
jgi:serine/alanine adding enzyme